jgi:hypothetical protein
MHVQAMAERIDRLINVDFGGRGIENLYQAARSAAAEPLSLGAARELAGLQRGSTVIVTTGSASRAWISSGVVESDGPAGTAAVARALSLGLDVIPVVVAEAELLGQLAGIFTAAGMCPLTLAEAKRSALPGGRLSVVVMAPYPVEDGEARAHAEEMLSELQPSLLFAAERPGFSSSGVYHNARGVDYGAGKARVDYLFQAANRRGLPTIGVGDGGNEIGMGAVAEAVRLHVPFGDRCLCGCGAGIGAVTPADHLVTAAVSNWGCYAIAAGLAVLLDNPELVHTAEMEENLLRRGVELGLINSPQGRVDPNVDAIPLAVHKAMVTLMAELAARTGKWR